ncbi:MAG: hypothetical protein IPP71_01285 [Bacteroidetes bacterium]|nr:hypothetical protein [Bacteroidota bacterium]
MIPFLREQFNANFTDEKYAAFIDDLNAYAGEIIPFRIAETPVFIPAVLKQKLVHACEEIISVIKRPDYKALTDRAIPPGLKVPGEEGQSMWLAFDFAICRDANWQLDPQLIEMQGFPSLFFYQHLLGQKFREHYGVSNEVSHLAGMTENEYVAHMCNLLLNGHHPDHVILLEVEPEKQNTRIDFLATFINTGIRPVCISKIKKEGRQLFYELNGKLTPVKRIYNRVIFDEFKQRKDLSCEFNLTEEVDVEWAGHPNWFFRISKFTMPFLKNPFVPETIFLHELSTIPLDLENYVLKPLFSFSGSGVVFHVTKEAITNVKDPENWILQRKVKYEPIIPSTDGNVKTEIRMLYSWTAGEQDPKLIINMARLSKGEMIGVKFNLNKTWVGGSVGYFEKDPG